MLTYKGGDPAKNCFYWKKGEWEIVTVEEENGRLPGGADSEYIRVPGLLLLPAALMLSGLFVIFLPFVGFAVIFVLIAMKAGQGLGALGARIAENVAQLAAQLMGGNPRPAMVTIFGTAEAGLQPGAGEERVGGGGGRVTETTEDLVTDTAEELEAESEEDPVGNTAEGFAMESAEHRDHAR